MDVGATRLLVRRNNMTDSTMKESSRFIPTTRLAAYDVSNKKGQDMGRVQNFVVDMQTGRIAFAIVSFEGFLGITDKWFAMPWGALEWHQETSKFILDMPEEVLKNAPGIHKDKWIDEVNKWQEDKDLALIASYYASYGYKSYLGIAQEVSAEKAEHEVVVGVS
jgi:sporulation protein YlmC with PRC-barrel domain